MKKHLLNATLGALVLLTLWTTGCSKDKDYPDVNGDTPSVTLKTEHAQTAAGRTFKIEGTVSDSDGISMIKLECSDLNLNKTINLIDIYQKPLETYELSYQFEMDKNEIGERFTIQVTIIDVGGRSFTKELLVTMDGDFENPTFTLKPEEVITVLAKAETKFNFRFTVEDDREMSHVVMEIPGLEGFSARRIEANGQKGITFSEKITLPNAVQNYPVTLTAVDKKENETVVRFIISVSEMPDFEKMYLSDVATADELTSDIFGVPMRIDRIAAFQYRARYYCRAANTEIFFLPQKSDFAPISFGLDPDNSQKLTDDPETAKPIVLTEANVYYEITFDIKQSTFETRTYPVTEATNRLPQAIGSDYLLDPAQPQHVVPFQIGILGNLPGCNGSPSGVLLLTQDKTNPHLFYTDDIELEAGKDDSGNDKRLNFIIHNRHDWGWWDYCLWRLDNSDDPELFRYSGADINPKPQDIWGKPIVKTGTFRFWFDAHLERGKLVQVK